MRQRAVLDYAIPDTRTILFVVTVAVGCFCHFFRIDLLPMGFYFDESSIGYNAYLISRTGADEHGEKWPLFFEAFGEYKNPLYIYLLAGFYRIFGYSEWTTRALSACCWLVGSFCLYGLTRRLFADNVTRLYVALSLAFTPWLFTLSRISFELIALYPLLALHLLALQRGFEENSLKWAVISGIAIGLCVYAYTTFRLLTPLYCLLVLVCYFAPHYRKTQIAFALGAAVCFAPYVLYVLGHFNELTVRFDTLTYLHDPALSGFEKAWIFLANYVGYFSPAFLAISGDLNRRHHTGFGGELLVSTVFLLSVALVTLWKDRRNLFRLYLVAGLLLSPIAAALTRDTHHSLRAFSMAIFAILLSAYGIRALKPSLARGAVTVTGLCAILYTIHYFTIYPRVSAVAFENYGFKQALNEALSRTHGRVVLFDQGVQYINLRFFGSLAGTRVPLLSGSRNDVLPGDVFIYTFYDRCREMMVYGVWMRPAQEPGPGN